MIILSTARADANVTLSTAQMIFKFEFSDFPNDALVLRGTQEPFSIGLLENLERALRTRKRAENRENRKSGNDWMFFKTCTGFPRTLIRWGLTALAAFVVVGEFKERVHGL